MSGPDKRFREPLTKMATVERCRWFAENLLRNMSGIGPGSTEFEEALIFEDAANEIEDLHKALQDYLDRVSGGDSK